MMHLSEMMISVLIQKLMALFILAILRKYWAADYLTKRPAWRPTLDSHARPAARTPENTDTALCSWHGIDPTPPNSPNLN